MKNLGSTIGKRSLSSVGFALTSMVSTQLFADSFGAAPMCEASAALVAPCPRGGGDCLYVGDNEQAKRLFYFPLRDGVADITKQTALDLSLSDPAKRGIFGIEDIEALAPGPSGTMYLFGSYSRNKECKAKKKHKKRRRFANVSIGPGGATGTLVSSPRLTCADLFPGGTADPVIAATCAVIEAREKAADRIEEDLDSKAISSDQAKSKCNALAPFNAEGAVNVGGPNGLWIGLRAPLLDQHPTDPSLTRLAILLHLSSPTKYAFDRVALLDLDSRGIRELAAVGEMIYVIAGPPEDLDACFQLRRFPAKALSGQGVIRPELVGCLLTSSEGLAASASRFFVTIDGDKGDYKTTGVCKTPSGFIVLPQPSH